MKLQRDRMCVRQDAEDADVIPHMAAHIKYSHGCLIVAQSGLEGIPNN